MPSVAIGGEGAGWGAGWGDGPGLGRHHPGITGDAPRGARPDGAHPVMRHTVLTEAGPVPGLGAGPVCHVTPLRRFPLLVQVTAFDLAEIRLLIGRATPLAIVSATPPDSALILVPLDGWQGLVLGGRAAQPDDIALFGPGAVHELALARDVSWGALMAPVEVLGRLLGLPRQAPLRRPGTARLERAEPGARRRAEALLRDVAFVAVQDPDVFRAAEAVRSLRCSLLGAFAELVEPSPLASPHRPGRAAAAPLRQVVRDATALLAAHPDRLGGTAALAAALGISGQRLCGAVETVLGISAERYLLTRRLVMYREALHAPTRRLDDPAGLAARFGFADDETLPRAYRRLFNEPPPEA